MPALELDSPLQLLKGVGPARAEAFAELGVRTVADLLCYFPFRYEQELGHVEIAALRPGAIATIRGTITRVGGRYPGFTATVHDGTAAVKLRWFQRRQGGLGIYVGADVEATGPVEPYDDSLQIVQPSVRVIASALKPAAEPRGARQAPVYRATEQLPSATIRRIIEQLLNGGVPELPDALPVVLRRRHRLPSRTDAAREVHFPSGDAALAAARRRLAYEELFLLELAMALRRRKIKSLRSAALLLATPEIDRRIRARFPFALTPSQEAAIREIAADLGRGQPMTRLLQGDVGSGKTVVALYAGLIAVANKYQAALMSPTELLAQQHLRTIERFLHGSRVRTMLLAGAAGRSDRKARLSRIEAGEVDLVVGTQALIQHDVRFSKLGLVVVDEQHKFGVLQRATIRTKGLAPHYLVMTATPIPRTLAMTVFGDLDVSLLKESPPGRGVTHTRIITPGTTERLYAELRERLLRREEQAYVVCPMVNGASESGEEGAPPAAAGELAGAGAPLAAVEVFERLRNGPWQGVEIGLLHGAMTSAEKDAVIRSFASGRLRGLVSTTAVEVGVDVPGATIMVVESAERFGLSQLHQLRGRVGRGPRDADCFLLCRTRAASAAARLRVLTETRDGFRIAEADLRLRGPGELLGTRQHGLPELQVSDLSRDFELLELARADAFALIEIDPELRRPEHQLLRPALERMFGGKLALFDAA